MHGRVREVLAGLVVVAAVLIVSGIAAPPAAAQAPIAPAPKQPILFSHKIHAGDFKIDCQYCHADARRSTFAGVPSVKRCMGCHHRSCPRSASTGSGSGVGFAGSLCATLSPRRRAARRVVASPLRWRTLTATTASSS